MRRIVAALAALLLLAAPAHAYRVLVTTPTTPGNSTDNRGHSNYLRNLRNCLDSYGVQYDIIRGDALTATKVAAGSVTIGGITRTYDAAIVTSFTKGTTTYERGFGPDSLLRAAYRPSIPVLLVAAHWSVNGYQQASTCSSGVSTSIAATFTNETLAMGSGRGYQRSVYQTGYADPWKTYDGMWPMAVTPGMQSNGVMLRPLVQAHMSAATPVASRASTCTDCDSMGRAATDSTTLFRLSRTAANGDETGAPIFMAFPTLNGANGGINFSSGLMGMAIAALDSATRMTGFNPDSNRWLTGSPAPKVIGSKPGWLPRRVAIALTHAGGHSAGGAISFDGESGGLFLPDSATFKASLDSLNALGVPITVFYNTDRDTVAAYPNELAWYKAIRVFKFAPAPMRGSFSSTAGVTSSSVGAPIDVWGRLRARALYSADCATDTLSLYCGLARIKALNDSLFAGRTVRTLYAPAFDWLPAQYTRGNLPTRDSLVTVAMLAGFNSLVVCPDVTEQNPGQSFGYTNSAATTTYSRTATDVRGLFSNDQRVAAYRDFAKTDYAGTFNFPASRGNWGAEPASLNLVTNAGHWWSEEFLWGAFSTMGPWYPSDYPHYYHQFRTRLSILEAPVMLLAGDTANSGKRFGWWHIKHTVNQVKAVNRLAGRTVVAFAYTDDL